MAKRILVNDALDHIRTINMVTENNIINDAKRLYDIASGNKVGNKIMASVPLRSEERRVGKECRL